MRLDDGITSSRNLGVEVLRVLCVVYIIGFWHLLNYTDAISGYNNLATSTLTDIVLGTFVFLSGFFTSRKQIEPTIQGIWKFYVTKLLRIYPLYLAALAAFVALGLTSLSTAVKAAFFISMFVKPAPQTLWFMTMLMFFFVITPFILIAIQKFTLKQLIIGFSLILLGLVIYYFAFKLLDIRLVLYFPAYVASVLLATEKISFPPLNRETLLLLFAAIVVSLPPTPSGAITILMNAPLVTFSAVILFRWFSLIKFTRLWWLPIISFISYASYSMYLFHRPLLIMMKTLYFPQQGYLQVLVLLFLFFPFVIIFSYDIQKLYDIVLSYVTKPRQQTTN